MTAKVHLVSVTSSENSCPSWDSGHHLRLEVGSTQSWKAIEASLARLPINDLLLFWDCKLPLPTAAFCREMATSPGDLWHAGLLVGDLIHTAFLDYVHPVSMPMTVAPLDIPVSSWRMSLRACLTSIRVVAELGFLDPQFATFEGATLDWAFHLTNSGVLMRHLPNLCPMQKAVCSVAPPLEDELRFIAKHFGKKWLGWASVRMAIQKPGRILSLLKGLSRANSQALQRPASRPFHPLRQKAPAPSPTVGLEAKLVPSFRLDQSQQGRECNPTRSVNSGGQPRVTVLIPTVDRYAYIATLLPQLARQTVPPHEIVIVDQTAQDKRRPDIYAQYPHLPITVLYQDSAGQCSSRNAGIRRATGEFILFIDDDDEIAPNLIEAHLDCLEHFRADVSCGVADEVGAGPLPEAFTRIRTSDVFPTNNSMVRRESLRNSGLFDLAYNRGQRADGDLGMRLHKSGAMMVLNPGISVLHHHAPSGGLRKHKARVVTYASSRRQLTHRRLLSTTECYLNLRYFTERQCKEARWISVLGTFSCNGTRARRVAKIVVAAVLLPDTLRKLRSAENRAVAMRRSFPQIPTLQSDPEAQPLKET